MAWHGTAQWPSHHMIMMIEWLSGMYLLVTRHGSLYMCMHAVVHACSYEYVCLVALTLGRYGR